MKCQDPYGVGCRNEAVDWHVTYRMYTEEEFKRIEVSLWVCEFCGWVNADNDPENGTDISLIPFQERLLELEV